MLRIYCLQQWYNLSDPGAEEALYDILVMAAVLGVEPGGCEVSGCNGAEMRRDLV
jgi:hypothetical protein